MHGSSRTQFKPGQSGNPAGRPKKTAAEKLIDQISMDDLANAIIKKLGKSNILELLVKALQEPDSKQPYRFKLRG
jgi:Family of unknown function (DUF5681)